MKPLVLVVTNQENTSFDTLGGQLKTFLPEFTVRVTPAERIDNGAICDVLVCLWWRPLAEGLLGRVTVKKSVIMAVFDHHSWTFSRMYAAAMAKALKQADYLAVGNEALLDQLRRRYDTVPPTWVCETGVDTDRFIVGPYPQIFTALWCGNSRSGEGDLKGLEIVKEAASTANVPLVIADSLGEQGDKVSYQDMPAWYRRGTVLMIGSRSEGTPRTLLEAMACGRLIVSTRVGVVPRLVQHGVNGLIVDRDPPSMATGLRYLRKLLSLVDPQIPKYAARASAKAYDIRHKIGSWRACIMTAATGKWWKPAAAADETKERPRTQEAFTERVTAEIAELQGQPLGAGDCQKLIDDRDKGGDRPAVLLCSTYRFASRTLRLIEPLMKQYRFVMDQGDTFPKADIAWTMYPFADGQRAFLCHRSQGVPMVMTMRGQVRHLGQSTIASAAHLYEQATAIAVLTKSLKENLCRMAPSVRRKISVIPNGGYAASQPEFQTSNNFRRPLILFLTNFNFEGKRMAVDQVAQAFDRVEFQGSVLVGGQEGRFAPPKGRMAGCVTYLGFIKNKFALMKTADVFCYHSHIDGQPSALIEAMSMGMACVVGRSSNSGAAEFVRDGETGIVRDSPTELVQEVIRLASDKASAKKLGAAALQYVRDELTWEKSAQKYDDLFQSVLPPNKRR